MKWLSSMLRDENGEFSSKRFTAVLGALCLCVALFVSGFTAFNPPDTLIDSVTILTTVCLGFTSVDKFSKKKK